MTKGTAQGKRLSDLAVGTRARVLGVTGGHAMHARLAGLGLVAGARIEIHRNDASGPVILAYRNARIALGRGVAERVMVELAPAGRAGEETTDMRKSA